MSRFIFALLVLIGVDVYSAEPTPWQMNFQPAASPVMEEIELLHAFLMYIMYGVVAVIFVLLTYVCIRFNAKANPVPSKFSHNVAIEILWTLVPVIIISVIALSTFSSLRFAEQVPKFDMTVKVVGRQWYWTYSYPDNGGFEFDSYIIPDDKLQPGQKRLLDVDNRLVIPAGKIVRFLVTSSDVIHSFAVPAFGIKTDAVPGRANETWVKVNKPGVYYGQCSELCGVNHGFMPIAVEVVSEEEFIAWSNSFKHSA